MLETVMRVGVPIVEGVITAKERAIHLLKFAAEVAHALMAQYLYTYVSVVNSPAATLNREREVLNVAIRRWGISRPCRTF